MKHGGVCVEIDERIKRKTIKLQAAEERVATEDEFHMGGEDKRSLHTNGDEDAGHFDGLKANKDKNRHRKSRNEEKSDVLSSRIIHLDNSKRDGVVVGRQKSFEKTEDFAEAENGEKGSKKKNKRKRHKEEENDKRPKEIGVGGEAGNWKVDQDENYTEKVEKKKKKTNVNGLENYEPNNTYKVGKKKKKTNVDDLGNHDDKKSEKVEKKKTTIDDLEDHDVNYTEKVEKKKNKKKKKTNVDIRVEEIIVDEKCSKNTTNDDNDSTKRENENANKLKLVKNSSSRPKSKGKFKKVRVSGQVEIFPLSEGPSSGKDNGFVRGKRFSPEEDEIVKEAVLKYIEEHRLGEEGVYMVMHCRSYAIKNCWKEIGAFMPHRHYQSIKRRAHILFGRAERRGFSEEIELLHKLYKENGPQWTKIATKLGKFRDHVRDTWRRIKLPNMKRGQWSQEEYQNLFDLVNSDLRMKIFEEKKSKFGMLRDNICWTAISETLSTRPSPLCCYKWYNQLSSPMVVEGEWADSDDYLLVITLFDLDACCIEDVDWDTLLEHRSGDLCRKRWFQMVRHLGQQGNKSFAEQVDTVSKRYCPDMLEAREIWDNKPVVP